MDDTLYISNINVWCQIRVLDYLVSGMTFLACHN